MHHPTLAGCYRELRPLLLPTVIATREFFDLTQNITHLSIPGIPLRGTFH